MFSKKRGKMVRLRKTLWMDTGRKAVKAAVSEKEYEDMYDAFRECYLEVFHMPGTFELSVETCSKHPKEVAVFCGMEGVLE